MRILTAIVALIISAPCIADGYLVASLGSEHFSYKNPKDPWNERNYGAGVEWHAGRTVLAAGTLTDSAGDQARYASVGRRWPVAGRVATIASLTYLKRERLSSGLFPVPTVEVRFTDRLYANLTPFRMNDTSGVFWQLKYRF